MTTAEVDTPAGHDSSALAEPRVDRLAPYDEFVMKVREACGEPGTQQALRRGLGKPLDEMPARTHAALLRRGLVPDSARPTEKRAYYAVAALIAARPRTMRKADDHAMEPEDAGAASGQDEGVADPSGADPAHTAGSETERPTDQRPSWGTSLGTSLAQAVTRDRPDGTRAGGIESRLHLLVRQETDGMYRMLPAIARHLGSSGVPIDYGRLLHDIAFWRYQRGETAMRWLEDFYRTIRRATRDD
ncbi:type I-E CRISPR-associated protein Cse2/CasB [Streptomyces hainanensis]|nr:type I-E CRISPR-associated protein Cse2/CasB [Streptomyces hainanensis]